MNRFLQDRAYKRNSRDSEYYPRRKYREIEHLQSDMRNPYGSKGGYVVSKRDMGMDYNHPITKYDSRHFNNEYPRYMEQEYDMGYQRYGERYRPMEFDIYGNIMPRNMDYSSGAMEQEYKQDLHRVIERLKPQDRFNMSKEQVVQTARQMGANFNGYNEEEFYFVYLMLVSDYKKSINDGHIAIIETQEFLEDDDIAVSPSEKVCIYLYKIIMGE